MAGRILPLALAVVAGVSISVATFGEELKEQRRKRLQEEYEREVAAHAALTGQSRTPIPSTTIPPPSPHQIPVQQEVVKEDAKASSSEATSSWSSMIGLWAWKKGAKENAAPEGHQTSAPAQSPAEAKPGKP
ncbi:hypothetical protein HBH92_085220 [Parastagonospora nodorum]|nr:hypothetical protein HBH52_061850 [Parastagonospora nodorum]KAH4065751.1 hypothetical protein HBH50_160740 [Parastagonospora nodorum]KAH4092240.1 hypothetical protein HBH48_083800 [Parastagonospora nodorum]KAH4267451.1 hypothetical protein HBI03_066520 [Parastagonospora nodorum]KAH4273304.1 hypothetical protein HBI04_136340 [Parastagonospora nodorum]